MALRTAKPPTFTQLWLESMTPTERAVYDEIVRRFKETKPDSVKLDQFDPARRAEWDRLSGLYHRMRTGETVTMTDVTGMPPSRPRLRKRQGTFRQRVMDAELRAPRPPEPEPLPQPNGPKAGHLEFRYADNTDMGTRLLCPACFQHWEVRDIGTAQEHGGSVTASRFVLQHPTRVWCYRCGWTSEQVTSLGAAYSAAKDHITSGHGGTA